MPNACPAGSFSTPLVASHTRAPLGVCSTSSKVSVCPVASTCRSLAITPAAFSGGSSAESSCPNTCSTVRPRMRAPTSLMSR